MFFQENFNPKVVNFRCRSFACLVANPFSVLFLPFLDNQNNLIQNGLSIDPRYSAVYGNPYLRQSNNALPPLPPPSTANPSATPAPPPYNSVTRQQHQQGQNHLGMSPGNIVAANLLTKSSSSNLSNSNLAISNSNNNTLTSNSNLSNNSSSMNITNQLSSGMAMGSPSSNSTTTSSGQFILPSNGTFKKTGSLATHV